MTMFDIILKSLDKTTLYMGGAALLIGGYLLMNNKSETTNAKSGSSKVRSLNGVKKGIVRI